MSIANPAIPTPYIHSSQKRRKNVWYSIRDGNWTDPNTWMSNALSYCQTNFNYPGQAVSSPIFPAVGDDVYINHTVTLNTSVIVNNINISGTLKADNGARVMTVNGNIQAVGNVDFTGANITLALYGVDNFIVNFIRGNSTVAYLRYGDQYVMDLPYYSLRGAGSGTKYALNDLYIIGSYSIGNSFDSVNHTTIELGAFNFYHTGNASNTLFGTLSKNVAGTMTTNWKISCEITGWNWINIVDGVYFTINGAIVLGGINQQTIYPYFATTNASTLYFVAASFETRAGFYSVKFDALMLIADGSTLEIKNGARVHLRHILRGESATSKLLIDSGGYIIIDSPDVIFMDVGIIDNSNGIVGYYFNGDFTFPLSSYGGLAFSGTGVKTLPSSTTITQLIIDNTIASTTFDLGTGTRDLAYLQITLAHLNKTGTGDISSSSTYFSGNVINFSGGGTLESKGDINFNASSTITVILFKASTSNQNWTGNSTNDIVNATILISGAITVSRKVGSGVCTLTINGTLNGDNALSTFDNNLNSTVYYKGTQQPMQIGVLQCNNANNTFKYNLDGNQDVTGTTYRTLEFGGSGIKTLQGNVVVNTTAGGSWSITGTATINYNGYTISTI